MKNKIYLAKSNKVNPDDLFIVRDLLKKFDIEIVEFKGGYFSHREMLDCDYLVVLPSLIGDHSGKHISIGKGLYEQIKAFDKPIFFITKIEKDVVRISEIKKVTILDSDDFVNYGVVKLDAGSNLLKDVLTIKLNTNNKTGFKVMNPSTLLHITDFGTTVSINRESEPNLMYLTIKKLRK